VLDLRSFGDLDCVCDALFSVGDRVVAAVDNPGGASGVPAGALGTVRCGFQTGGAELNDYVYVSWDNWSGGIDDGSDDCETGCGDGSSSGANSHAFVPCDHLVRTDQTSVVAFQETLGIPSSVHVREEDSAIIVSQTGSQYLLEFTGGGGSPLGQLEELDFLFGQVGAVIGDLNGDMTSDLIVSIPLLETVAIAFGELGSTYQPWLGLSVDGEPSLVKLGDMDGDGDQDIAVLITLDSGQSSIELYRNDQTAEQETVFNALGSLDLGGLLPRQFVLKDLDLDGTADFVVVSEITGSQLAGSASFLQSVMMSGGDSAGGSCASDINGDSVVNGLDLTLLLGSWGSANALTDFSGDGLVNGVDLAILLGEWGLCE
ncbi:MAG: FG-GAP-like repeat-containing protein, partial [Phycisphaerales bacterium]|nr:FG-GAP-like repeat-containing protein [Phycisphaerales bacterium]